jgi:hypothetical protein
VNARASYASNGDGPGRIVHFWCPGCDDAHQVSIEHPDGWGFNGDLERPTITPSVLVHMTKWKGTVEEYGKWTRPTHPEVEPGGQAVCHSFVTDGRIQFLGDSTHQLAGQTVDLPPWPYS